MDGVRLSRQPAVGPVQDEPRREAQGGFRALHARNKQTMRARADRRVNRQKRQRAEPAPNRREDALSASGRWIITNRPPGASIASEA